MLEHRPSRAGETPAANSDSPVADVVASRPADVQRALDAAMVRIRSAAGEVVGSGFLVGPRHVVTCAHVVARALGGQTQQAPAETDTVSLDFPLVAAGMMVHARVEVWHPVRDDDKGDIAGSHAGGRPPGRSSPRLSGGR